MEISKDIGARRAAIASAVVVLVSPTQVFISNLNEAQLNKFGCSASVTGPDELSSLLDLLVEGGIEEMASFEKTAIDARIGIYLRWRDGEGTRLVFDGAGHCGTYNGVLAVCAANPRFAPELRAWAAARQPAAAPPNALRAKKKGLEIAL